jgi:hypothetical protein
MQAQVAPAYSTAEAAASVVTSASCYHLEENVGIVPVVEPKLELIQVERQIGFAHLVILSDDPTLEQAPKVFNRICVNDTTHIFARTMAYDLMWQAIRPFTEQAIAAVFIRGDQTNLLFVHGTAHELIERLGIGVVTIRSTIRAAASRSSRTMCAGRRVEVLKDSR